jgi:hypothetical protein
MQASIEFDKGEYFFQIIAETGAEALAMQALINGQTTCAVDLGQSSGTMVAHFKRPKPNYQVGAGILGARLSQQPEGLVK